MQLTKALQILSLGSLLVFFGCENRNLSEKGNVLDITINSGRNKKLYLYSYYGEKVNLVDSVVTDAKGHGQKRLPDNLKPGIYQLRFPNGKFIKFILNNEKVALKTEMVNPGGALVFTKSIENQKLRKYFTELGTTRAQMVSLSTYLLGNDPSDKSYSTSLAKFQELKQKENLAYDNLFKGSEHLLAARYTDFANRPVYDPGRNGKLDFEKFLEVDYWKGKDFSDSTLLNTDAFSTLYLNFLGNFQNRSLSKEEQDENFKKGVDIILKKAGVNNEVFAYSVSFLVDCFEKLKSKEVLAHIGKNYLPFVSCTDETLISNLTERIGKFEKANVGKTAADFKLPDISGKMVGLNDLKKDQKLIFFWKSSCSHCKAFILKLNEFGKQNAQKLSEIDIVSISLDEEKSEWENFINKNPNPWTNCMAEGSWNSEVAQNYNVFNTPTILLLDKENTIIGKPKDFVELAMLLK
ncbi:MAG: thioredoxin family protein [Flammeovirgaceae bacterium]|nr:thioredoxin family protein [Flammeovirgaceae bacterium]